ncbi:hypothetical protein [Streptomyces sp. WMMC897]|nr:hypothetical protein [Streptomyces sp. WMMC897]MCZ7413056.1 hypothetical protein [Streptomyces sp. WMMC897]MCZ7413144.1 hypothetical protein [Streptomyces sp. WMMC897]MCZ7415472.1 hypothetical protein [Streptomyces sp. WMMC897]
MRRHIRGPLARYGFAACAAVALATDQLLPALVCAALAAYAWKAHR